MNVNLNKTISILLIGTFLGTNVCTAMESSDGGSNGKKNEMYFELNAAEEYILSINSSENGRPLSLRNIAEGGMMILWDEMDNLVCSRPDLIKNIPEYCHSTGHFLVSIPVKIKKIGEFKNNIHFDLPSQLSSREAFLSTCGLAWDTGYYGCQVMNFFLENNSFKYIINEQLRSFTSEQLKNAVKKTAEFGKDVIDLPWVKYGVMGSISFGSSYLVGVAPWMFGYGLLGFPWYLSLPLGGYFWSTLKYVVNNFENSFGELIDYKLYCAWPYTEEEHCQHNMNPNPSEIERIFYPNEYCEERKNILIKKTNFARNCMLVMNMEPVVRFFEDIYDSVKKLNISPEAFSEEDIQETYQRNLRYVMWLHNKPENLLTAEEKSVLEILSKYPTFHMKLKEIEGVNSKHIKSSNKSEINRHNEFLRELRESFADISHVINYSDHVLENKDEYLDVYISDFIDMNLSKKNFYYLLQEFVLSLPLFEQEHFIEALRNYQNIEALVDSIAQEIESEQNNDILETFKFCISKMIARKTLEVYLTKNAALIHRKLVSRSIFDDFTPIQIAEFLMASEDSRVMQLKGKDLPTFKKARDLLKDFELTKLRKKIDLILYSEKKSYETKIKNIVSKFIQDDLPRSRLLCQSYSSTYHGSTPIPYEDEMERKVYQDAASYEIINSEDIKSLCYLYDNNFDFGFYSNDKMVDLIKEIVKFKIQEEYKRKYCEVTIETEDISHCDQTMKQRFNVLRAKYLLDVAIGLKKGDEVYFNISILKLIRKRLLDNSFFVECYDFIKKETKGDEDQLLSYFVSEYLQENHKAVADLDGSDYERIWEKIYQAKMKELEKGKFKNFFEKYASEVLFAAGQNPNCDLFYSFETIIDIIENKNREFWLSSNLNKR